MNNYEPLNKILYNLSIIILYLFLFFLILNVLTIYVIPENFWSTLVSGGFLFLIIVILLYKKMKRISIEKLLNQFF
jgi:hypothetical protein